MKCKYCAFRLRCWETDAKSIDAMKLALEEQTTDLLDGIEIVVNRQME